MIPCERGIRTFETAYRNTFDIDRHPLVKELSHLPVIADPSHVHGNRRSWRRTDSTRARRTRGEVGILQLRNTRSVTAPNR